MVVWIIKSFDKHKLLGLNLHKISRILRLLNRNLNIPKRYVNK
jgi:hypothetical protein